MAVYAAMIDRMDQGIGKIVDSLRKRGRFDNTLVVFLSDNGGCEETPGLPGILRLAMTGVDTSRWGNRKDVLAGPPDTFQSYGIPWANASNTPFRWYKSETHEGGIATPLVVHWPAGIGSALRGSLVHEPGHLIDLMATSVDLAGASYPAAAAGREVQPMEGVSLRPAFEGKPLARGKPLFFEHEGNRAIIDGSWKLVSMAKGKWQLYDLSSDRTELKNLAAEQPERVETLAALWQEWARRANVTP
jgi:arylsulfatase